MRKSTKDQVLTKGTAEYKQVQMRHFGFEHLKADFENGQLKQKM